MKKLLVIPFLAAIFFASCKRNPDTVSTLATYSVPTITVSGDQFYSIPVGGSLPSISATAYDSFYKESYPVVVDASTLDNTTPGLYVVTMKSTNKYGMIGTKSVYVAVTDVSAAVDLSGVYARTSNGVTVNVTKVATGLYRTDNVGGVASSSPGAITAAYFVQTSDTSIDLPLQETSLGTLYGVSTGLTLAPGDTSYQYAINGNSTFGTAVRVFVKQ